MTPSNDALQGKAIAREMRRIEMMKPDMKRSKNKKTVEKQLKNDSVSERRIENFLAQDSDESDYSYYNFKNGAQRPQRNEQKIPKRIFQSQYNKERLGDSQYCFNLVLSSGSGNFSTN